jgi:hypothetical protein
MSAGATDNMMAVRNSEHDGFLLSKRNSKKIQIGHNNGGLEAIPATTRRLYLY